MRTGKGFWGWHASVEVQAKIIWVWVSESTGHDVLRAALPREPRHYRALLTMFEGLALWSGAPLTVVIGADHPVCDSLGLGRWGADEIWPEESPLVNLLFRQPARPPRRLGRFDECTQCGEHTGEDGVW
jgi:hypothetical protein